MGLLRQYCKIGLWGLALLSFFYGSFTISQPEKTIQYVRIIQNVEHPALNAARQGIMDELRQRNIKVDFDTAQGNPALALQIAQKFVGSDPAVMVGIGTTATQALMAANQHHTIPIVFSSVTDPKGAKLVNNLKNPEGLMTGISDCVDPSVQFDLFKKIMPSLTKIGIIYSPGEPNSIALNEQMKKVAAQKGLQLMFTIANTSAEVAQAARHLIGKKVQAIFINNDNIALSAFDAIVKVGNESKIPVFCSDIDMVERGALAALGPNQYELGKQAGKLILQILAGQKINQLPILFPEKTEIYINLKEATLLNISIPQAILTEATQVVR